MNNQSISEEFVEIEVVSGVEGKSLYIDGLRVSGNKPWGGGTVTESFKVSKKNMEESLSSIISQAIADERKELREKIECMEAPSEDVACDYGDHIDKNQVLALIKE